MVAEEPDRPNVRIKDGSAWQIGSQAEVAWVNDVTSVGRAGTVAIPAVFEAYATVELPANWEQDQAGHDAAVVEVLREQSDQQVWWLGYLDTGADDVVFSDAPMVSVYQGWRYVLVRAGPEQALSWRHSDGSTFWKGALPNLMFAADRSWLVSTLWDDDWMCIGGPAELIDGLLAHPVLRPRARRVGTDDESDPRASRGGHVVVDEPFIVNLAEVRASGHPRRATILDFEAGRGRFADTGVNVQIMQPGQPNCRYHSEPVQEDFLVLHGECTAIIDGEERRLGRWDFLHCPAGTDHVFVGAGDGPCAVLMIGSRRQDAAHYPVNALAANFDASVAQATDDPARFRQRLRRRSWRSMLSAGRAFLTILRCASRDEATQQIPSRLRRRDAHRRLALAPRARLARPPALLQLIDQLVISNRRHPDLPCRIAVVEQG